MQEGECSGDTLCVEYQCMNDSDVLDSGGVWIGRGLTGVQGRSGDGVRSGK